jgi:hypothetical protein
VAKELTVSTPSGQQYGFTSNGRRNIYSSTLFGQVLFSYGGNWLDENNKPQLTTPEAHEGQHREHRLRRRAKRAHRGTARLLRHEGGAGRADPGASRGMGAAWRAGQHRRARPDWRACGRGCSEVPLMRGDGCGGQAP